MFRAGDKFLDTQFGNNDLYNQDNEIGWLDWRQLQANPDIQLLQTLNRGPHFVENGTLRLN